jgi:hypothetical protein
MAAGIVGIIKQRREAGIVAGRTSRVKSTAQEVCGANAEHVENVLHVVQLA